MFTRHCRDRHGEGVFQLHLHERGATRSASACTDMHMERTLFFLVQKWRLYPMTGNDLIRYEFVKDLERFIIIQITTLHLVILLHSSCCPDSFNCLILLVCSFYQEFRSRHTQLKSKASCSRETDTHLLAIGIFPAGNMASNCAILDQIRWSTRPRYRSPEYINRVDDVDIRLHWC